MTLYIKGNAGQDIRGGDLSYTLYTTYMTAAKKNISKCAKEERIYKQTEKK